MEFNDSRLEDLIKNMEMPDLEDADLIPREYEDSLRKTSNSDIGYGEIEPQEGKTYMTYDGKKNV